MQMSFIFSKYNIKKNVMIELKICNLNLSIKSRLSNEKLENRLDIYIFFSKNFSNINSSCVT